MKSFCDGYAKSIRLFPNIEEGIYSDWEKIGNDIEVSFTKYKKKLDIRSCQTKEKSLSKKKRMKKYRSN